MKSSPRSIFQACLEDCLLDEDCDDELTETTGSGSISSDPDWTYETYDPNCRGREQCIPASWSSDADDSATLDSTSIDDETYSGPDCIATDCVGEPCEEGDSDTRSGSTYILTCVNGVWEGENVYHEGSDYIFSDSSNASGGPVLGEVCDIEGQTIDYYERNEYKSDGRTCMITHWICENGVWDHVAECHCPPGAGCSDDDSGSGTINPDDYTEISCVGSFCAGDPCDKPGYIGEEQNQILVCENGEWSVQYQPHGSLPWLGDGPPPWADENGCVNGYPWFCNDYSECGRCDYESDSGSGSESGSADCTYGGEECVGKPCNVNKKSPVYRDSGLVYNCVDGVWVEDWEDESGPIGQNPYETGSEPSESGSGPVLFEPCDNEGEIIPISQHYTANFESSGSDDPDARIKIVKGRDLWIEYTCIFQANI